MKPFALNGNHINWQKSEEFKNAIKPAQRIKK